LGAVTVFVGAQKNYEKCAQKGKRKRKKGEKREISEHPPPKILKKFPIMCISMPKNPSLRGTHISSG
jgi:hypothetical protein